MKNFLLTVLIVFSLLSAETLFEVKDSSNNKVLDVSTDGLRVMNEGDTLMVISAETIRANISSSKGLSRSFSVTTTSSVKGKGMYNALEVSSGSTTMSAGSGEYTDFSPDNLFLGLNAGSNITGTQNILLGNNSAFNGSSCNYNIMIGDQCGYYNTSGGNNLFIGNNAGRSNTTGSYNLFIGNDSGRNNTAPNNMFMGHNAGYTNSSGSGNFFSGTDAGAYNTTGANNVFVGQQTGVYNTTGDNNTFVGRWAGNSNTLSSADNTFIGHSAGNSQSSGNQNTYIGSGAGKDKTSGYYNTFVGYTAGENNGTGTGNVFLGYQAGYNETGSNKLYIDNSTTSSPLIYGDFSSNALTVNGSLTLDYGTGVNEFSIDGTLGGNSDNAVPTEKAVRTYVGANGDNLGNHTATQNIRLGGYYLSNDGGNEGVFVDTGGDVGIGTNAPGSNRLRVTNSASGIAGSTGYFENTNSLGIGLSVYAASTDVAMYVEQKHTTGGNIAKFASQYGGSWHESVVFKNSGGIVANNLSSGTGTYLVLNSSNEIVKYSSSRKYKKNIETLSVDREKFMKLRPVDFVWNEKSASEGKKDKGLIAEEVAEIDQELAVFNEDGSIEGVDYHKINIMLLKVVQDQQKQIEKLVKTNDILLDRIEAVEKMSK